MKLAYELVRALVLFAAVAALAYLGSRYVAERWRQRAVGRRLAIVEALAVGPRRHVCLLRVGDEVLCLGLGEGGVALLARFRGEAARRLLQAEGVRDD